MIKCELNFRLLHLFIYDFLLLQFALVAVVYTCTNVHTTIIYSFIFNILYLLCVYHFTRLWMCWCVSWCEWWVEFSFFLYIYVFFSYKYNYFCIFIFITYTISNSSIFKKKVECDWRDFIHSIILFIISCWFCWIMYIVSILHFFLDFVCVTLSIIKY